MIYVALLRGINVGGKNKIDSGFDSVRYVPGAVLWSVSREELTRSGMTDLARSALYKQMTIRNVNTTRAIYRIMGRHAPSD